MQRRQHDIELFEHAIGEVERAVDENVDFAAVQDRDVVESFAQRRDFIGLPFHRVGRQAARRRRMRRVIGDRHVFVPQRAAGVHHRVDRIAAVAVDRMHVEIAANVVRRDEDRQLASSRDGDLVVALPDFRRDPRQTQRRVDVGLCRRGPRRAIGCRVQSAARQSPSDRLRVRA